MEGKFALVSVCVVTYNSEKTIRETLDSILAQTYPRLELIVSDDRSTDQTVRICQDWLEKNRERFQNTELIVRDQNGGVARNLNTAIQAAAGEWVKPIAGDDLLMPDCIASNMAFAEREEKANVIFSKSRDFYTSGENRIVTDSILPGVGSMRYFQQTAKGQYTTLLTCNFVSAPTQFWRRSFAASNPYQEQYSFCEDWPQWLKLTSKGERLYFLDKETVLYRRGESLSSAKDSRFVNPGYFDSCRAFFFNERYEPLSKLDPDAAQALRKEFLAGELAVVLMHNRKNLFTRGILFILKRMLGIKRLHFIH